LFGILAAGVASLAFIEADFQVHCRGQLEPTRQRDIFAPATGTIEQLSIDSGDGVSESDHLLRIASTELDYELGRVHGELETHRRDLHALQARSRTAADNGGNRQGQMLAQAVEETMLESTIETLEEQWALLHSREDELTVTSPLRGTVMTPDVARRLTSRPVRQGQRLLTVAAVDDDWQLNLKIADRDFGHVRDALDEGHGSTTLDYMLTTDPGQKYEATLANIGLTTEFDQEIGAFVRGTVEITDVQHDTLKSGATVIGRINCGRRPLAFVWFRDVWEVLRTRFFW
jgi:multidrug efflux pump subunit AcrA (membrane-fusion protein)